MYRVYLVPDATKYNNRAAMYQAKYLLWDPRSESDAYAIIGPKWKGELNKAEAFEFTILPANVCYEQIHKKLSVVIIYDDDEWIFEGVVSDCPKDFFKQMKVTCSGPLSYLCDSVQAPDEKNEISIPKASKNTYARVPKRWYNNANPHEQGWLERSDDVDDDGRYTYTITSDASPVQNKIYYYVSSGDNQNHSGSTITKKAATKESIETHLNRLLEVHNSQVDEFKRIYLDRCAGGSTQHEFKSSNYRETWSAIKSDIIEQYGRYMTIKMDDNYILKLNYLELSDMDNHSTPQTSIVFTENMIEMSESDDSDDDVFTVLVPVGKNNLTVSGVTGHDSPEHNDNRMVDPYVKSWGGNKRYVIVSKYAVDTYGYIVKTQTFSDASTASALWTAAVKYIKNNFDSHTEYEVKGVDKFILGSSNVRITVGKKCRVKSGWHGIDEKDLYVISAELDFVSPDNDTYKIGIPTSDREAINKTLTGQTTSSSTNNKNSSANNAAGLNTVTSWLENYFTENEGWLELHNKFRNQVESENGMLLTRFEQTEEHINMLAQKVFGVAGSDGVADQDAGWIRIPKPPYRKTGNGVEDYYESSDTSNTTYKVPSEHNWFVKNSSGQYVKSTQDTRVTQAQVNNSSVDFYIMRLATRVSQIDVGQGGIKFRVDGNYERSTYCSSWIEMNEKAILALTGSIYVDENGQVIIKNGSGFRTGHSDPVVGAYRYYQVERTMYSQNPNPKQKDWYERKLDSSGAWLGQDKADQATNDNYYQSTNDTSVNRSKYYYYKSNVTEKYSGDYGVYDEDNLRAGVLAQMINNPTYRYVGRSAVEDLKDRDGSPKAQGWYEYDERTGDYGLTLDTHVVSLDKKYYEKTNNTTAYTEIRGEHIVIGKTPSYTGMSEKMKKKVDQYIQDNNLDGTITEIASDVVVVNALFARFIHFDDAEGDTISVHAGEYDYIKVTELEVLDQIYAANASMRIAGVNADILQTGYLSIDGTTFGSYETEGGGSESGNNADDIVMGFDTPTTDGDTVTIRYRTAGMSGFNNNVAISFDKPASLGTVTWSSGGRLKVETAGGKTFFTAVVTIPTVYSKTDDATWSNQIVSYSRTGYNVYRVQSRPAIKAHMKVSGTWSGLERDPEDPAPEISGWSKDIYIDATDAYDDGWDQARLKMDWPAAMQALGERTELTIKYPSSSVNQDASETLKLLDADTKGTSGYIRVYRNYVNNNNRGLLIGAIQVGDWYTAGKNAGAESLEMTPSSNKTLGYGSSNAITVKATTTKADGTKVEKSVKITPPDDNSVSLDKDDVQLGTVTNNGNVEPSADASLNNTLASVINAASSGNWISFVVTVKNNNQTLVSKKYKMKV